MKKASSLAWVLICLAAVGALMYLAYGQGTGGQPSSTPVPEAQSSVAGKVLALRPVASVARRVDEGQPFVTMRIPRFGSDWEWTAFEGTADWVIANGPGHYRGTVLPGERGNSAFAAHRAGHGDPFIDFDLLQPGDKIFLEQGKRRWVYQVTTRPERVMPSEVWVLDTFAPGRWLTLTTCWPKYGSSERLFIRAKMVEVD